MGVTTTADEKLNEAREHLKQAQIKILEVLNPDTWGHNEFNAEYIFDLHKAAFELNVVKNLVR